MQTLPRKSLNTNPGTDLFWESRVALSLGVPRKLLASLRDKLLTPGTDFVRRENNAVALTVAGMAKLDAAIEDGASEALCAEQAPGAKETTGNQAPEKKSDVPVGPPIREMMTVERLSQNCGLMLAITHKRTAPVMLAVRVRDNTNFAPGMIFEAIESCDGIWQFRNQPNRDESTVGRLPRQKGKW